MQGNGDGAGMRERQSAASLPGAEAAGFDARCLARHLLRTIRAGALATCDASRDGHPLATLVSLATAIDGAPLLLLSQLSAHRSKSRARPPRASLLLAARGKGDPLAHPRLSLIGRVQRLDDTDQAARARSRFLARHPKAKTLCGFHRFRLVSHGGGGRSSQWRLRPRRRAHA